MIQTNRLTEKLAVQYSTVSGNSYGAPIEVWSDVRIVFGSITNQRGNNSFSEGYDGKVYTDAISFYLRYLPIAKKGVWIHHYATDSTYEIINVTHVGRNQATVVDCVSVK